MVIKPRDLFQAWKKVLHRFQNPLNSVEKILSLILFKWMDTYCNEEKSKIYEVRVSLSLGLCNRILFAYTADCFVFRQEGMKYDLQIYMAFH